jgi:hypothetical protein
MQQRVPALARQDFIHQIILLVIVIILMIQKTIASTGIATSRGSMSAIQYKPYTLDLTPFLGLNNII